MTTFPENAPSANPVFYRTYSRVTDNGVESWDNVCDRTVRGIQELGKLTDAEVALLKKQQQKLTAMPSGRWLWVGGTEWILDPKNFYGAYNCSSSTVDSWQAFGQIMNLAMQGCGTGADLAYRHITKIPAITTAIKIVEVTEIGSFSKEFRIEGTYLCSAGDGDRPNLQQLVVGDSRQGWVDAYQALLELSSSGAKEVELIVDLRNVRPKGEKLKGFGGVANPAKLPGLFARCAEILGEAIGQKLTAEQCCLLIDEAALVVVAGSIRRSAGIRQFDESTPLLKENLWVEGENGKWSIDPKRDALRMANHTRVFHRKPTLEECISSVRSQYYSGEGAIQWAGEAERRAQGKGRYGLNPCVTADTWVHTENGPCQVKDLIGKQRKLYVNGNLHETTEEGFFHSGTKPVFKLSTVEGYELRLTDNHAVLKVVNLQDKSYEWTEVQNLVPGDRILLHNHREADSWRGRDASIGYLQGLFDARAEVVHERVELSLDGIVALRETQRSLARLGIISTLLMSHGDLAIEGDNLFWFQKIIGFRRSLDSRRLNEVILSQDLRLEDFTATVASLSSDGTEDVYDCTVPSAGCFDANGIFAHNCGEIIGENFMCNLSEIHLNLIAPLDFEAQRDAFTAGAIAVSALLNHKFDQERYAKSREEDPIVGVSFTGLFDFFVNLLGVDWLKWWEAGRPEDWVSASNTIREDVAERFWELQGDRLGAAFRNIEAQYLEYWKSIVEEVIEEYCDRHQIKCPNRTTTCQPAGTKSLLTGASPGWHPPKAQQFIRRITMGAYDPVALACIDFGYNVIPSQEAKDEQGNLLDDPFDPRVQTWLVEIPTKVCWADIPGVQGIDISKFTALAQFDFYMQVQTNYTTHNSSATIELREPEIEALGTRIYEAIANDEGYVSATILGRFDDIKTYPRLPFEPITVEEYELMHSQVLSRRKVSDFHTALASHATSKGSMEELMQGPAGCDGDKCLIGDIKNA